MLDEDYERELGQGRPLWVLSDERTPTPWSGRYLVVVDSMSRRRPDWSPQPARR